MSKKNKDTVKDEVLVLNNKQYEKALKTLHVELVHLQRWVEERGLKANKSQCFTWNCLNCR